MRGCCRFLDPDYRRPLILQELLGFNADIICLQEVDEKAFAEYFQPQLQQAGMPVCTIPQQGLNFHVVNAAVIHKSSLAISEFVLPC